MRLSKPIAILAMLAVPAAADEASEAFLDHAMSRCGELMAAPEAAVAGAVLRPGKASGAITADRAILSYASALEEGEGSISLYRSIYPGGTVMTCTATRIGRGEGDTMAETLPALIDAAAAGLLGTPVTRAGGPVVDPDGKSVMMSWYGEGFPPRASIGLIATPKVTILSRTVIAEGQR